MIIMTLILRLAEFLTVFVIVKGAIEFRKNCKHVDNGGVYGNVLHSNQHMISLVAIIFYNILNLISFVYYEDALFTSKGDFGLMVFKLIFLDFVWLVVINHFIQQRTNRTRPIQIKDLFTKF